LERACYFFIRCCFLEPVWFANVPDWIPAAHSTAAWWQVDSMAPADSMVVVAVMVPADLTVVVVAPVVAAMVPADLMVAAGVQVPADLMLAVVAPVAGVPARAGLMPAVATPADRTWAHWLVAGLAPAVTLPAHHHPTPYLLTIWHFGLAEFRARQLRARSLVVPPPQVLEPAHQQSMRPRHTPTKRPRH
jgi:hypothetical protein